MKTIKIPELKLEVELEETQKGVAFKDIVIRKGWRLLTGIEAMFLWENYRDRINLDWFFVKPTHNFAVARFVAGSDGADLLCDWYPGGSFARLGVRLCRSYK